MKLSFIGADHVVTGSCHYLNIGDKHILVDYGMEQGSIAFEHAELPVSAAEIDYVLLTHAHIDHSGNLPLLYARGFRGKIFMTRPTADLCNIMLRDCAHIQMQEAEWRSRKGKRNKNIKQIEPLYTMEDADNTLRHIVPCEYNQKIDIPYSQEPEVVTYNDSNYEEKLAQVQRKRAQGYYIVLKHE